MNETNNENLQTEELTQQELGEQLQIRREKLSELQAAGKDPFQVTTFKYTDYAKQITDKFEEYENKTVKLSGRMMSRRDMGKASFMDLRDSSGKVQIYVKIDLVTPEVYEDFLKWDLGDIIGVEGEVFKTRHGEISVRAKQMILLSKSLRPMPEKWHGLKDTDTRYRQRYLDLIANPEVKENFINRSKAITAIRSFLESRGYLEVETPVLHNIAGGASARPFITHHNTLDIDLYLRIALELHLKRLIIGGFDRVYEIGRVFRNEGMSIRHNPEFTLLELYEAYTDVNGMMDLAEGLFRHVANAVCGTGKIVYGDVEIDLDKPFERISMVDAVKKYTGVDFAAIETLEEAREVAKKHGVEVLDRHKKGDILNLFFEEFAEEKLIQPTFLTQHPVDISPLAKRMPENPEYTERFELFIIGREFANAFSELNDPIDQRSRFEHQADLKSQGDDEAADVDEDFLLALEYGMPPTGGMGIGIDRLVMLVTNTHTIRDVLLFPTMKPLK